MSRRFLPLAVLAAAAACSPGLPEADSAGARLYVERCGGCHHLHLPGSLNSAMWEMQVERMQGELVRRGVPPLTADEKQTILSYLRRHSGDAPAASE